ncbi:MAG: anti-sigma factor [Vicinamibacterales bacterium]
MTPPMVGCETARPLLSEFVDGELAVPEQVMMEAHVRVCRECAAHVEDLQVIGGSLRRAAPCTPGVDLDLDVMVGQLSERVQAEHAMSWAVRVRQLCGERRVAWALAGATCGVVVCALLTAALAFALEVQTANSLASVMRVLASPGSDANPMMLDARMLPPRLTIPAYADDAPELSALADDVVFAIAGTVTRQGKLRDYTVLGDGMVHDSVWHDGDRRRARATGESAGGPEAFMERAVSRLRFAPAQSQGEPVAVNLVWVVARTTVRGSTRDVLPASGPLSPRRPS